MSNRHFYRRPSGRYYFRWVLPPLLTAALGCSPGREMRFSLFTFDRSSATETAARLWLRCRQLLNGNPQEHGVRSFADITRFVKAAMSNSHGDLVPLLELTGSVVPAELRSALGYLLTHNVEFQIPAPSSGCTVLKHTPASERPPATRRWSPDGIWEPSTTIRATEFSHGIIPRDTLDAVLTDTLDVFYVKALNATTGGKQVVLTYQPSLKTTLHQLLVRRDLPEQIQSGLRGFLCVSTPALQLPAVAKAPSKLLSAEIDAFCTKKSDVTGTDRRRRAWTPKTLKENRAIYAVFLEIVGDKPVLEITSDDYDRYMSALKRLPPNRNKNPKYRDLTVTEILALPRTPDTKVCEARTVEKAHSTVCQLVRFIAKRAPAGQMNTSIFDELKIAKSTRAELLAKRRMPFSSDQLKTMFESERALSFLRDRKRPHPYQVWLPPLALYTGARIGELSQLALTDFGEENGTPYLNIRFAEDDDEDGESVKTVDSERRIPIHPVLVEELGLLRFVGFMRSQHERKTEGRLFPELKSFKGKGYGKESGRWFNSKLLTAIGIKSRGVVFHCFRHTASGTLIRADVLPWRISRYFGHAPSKDDPESLQSYFNERKLEDLLPVIAALKFPIDWSKYKALTEETFVTGKRRISRVT